MKKEMSRVLKVILKTVIGIIFVAILYNLFRGNFWITMFALLVIWVIYAVDKSSIVFEKRLKCLEENPPHSGGICYIVDFLFSLSRPFLEVLQEKTGFDKDVIAKIANIIPSTRFKIETYEKELTRVKIWQYRGEKESYYEDDNPELYKFNSYVIWNVNFWEHLLEEQQNILDSEHLLFSYNGGVFQLSLIGGRFKSKEFPDHCEPLEENILYKIPTQDFKKLEKYHLLYDEAARDATCPGYYSPSEEHRTYRYSSMFDKTKNLKGLKGVSWTLNWYDYTGRILPKLRYDEKKKDYIVEV